MTEAVTCVAEDHVPDEVNESVCEHFSEKELANPSLVVATIKCRQRFPSAVGESGHLPVCRR
jgi:hypothetical protein